MNQKQNTGADQGSPRKRASNCRPARQRRSAPSRKPNSSGSRTGCSRSNCSTPSPELNAPLRRAANDAAALAWATVFPLLVFPVLFEEKTEAALLRAGRQARIYANSQLVAA
jgi:hypothetical protein